MVLSTKVESTYICFRVYNESIVDKKFMSKIIEPMAERDIKMIVNCMIIILIY